MTESLELLRRAELLLDRGSNAQALPLLKRAARGAGADLFLKAEIAWKRGEALRAQGRFNEALRAYEISQRLYLACRVPSESLRAWLGASACLRILGRFERARGLWRRIRKKYPGYFSRTSPAVSSASPEELQLEIALVERGAGRLGAARKILIPAIRAFSKSKDTEGLRHAWWALGGIERFSGRYRPALAAFKMAERLARQLGDSSAVAYALCGQAGCQRILGKGKLSLKSYRQAFQIFRRLRDSFGQAYGLCGMGNALRVWGDAKKSLPLYRRSAALYTRVGDKGSLAFAWWGRAGSLRRLGEHREAQYWYEKALRAFRQVKDARGEIMALLGIARTAHSKAAFLTRRAALRLAQRHHLPYEAALALWELKRNPKPLQKLGVSPTVFQAWQDVP